MPSPSTKASLTQLVAVLGTDRLATKQPGLRLIFWGSRLAPVEISTVENMHANNDIISLINFLTDCNNIVSTTVTYDHT